MLFSYNWLQDYIKEKLPEVKKLAELLTLHSFEVEEVKQVGNDWVLNIDIRPNRAGDCFSHLGVARECAALLKSEIRNPKSEIEEDKNLRAEDFVAIEVRDQVACPRFTARVITGVKVEPSPQWMQERLVACGLRPINNIVDTTNYVMLETGEPLHAYDGEKLKAKKLIIRFAKKGEKMTTLDNQNFDFDENVLIITDEKEPVCIAGVKGGKIPEIDRNTKIVVLEGANWNQKIIRKGSKALNLETDASLRFEHGVPLSFTELGVNRAAFLMQEIAGGKIAKGLIDVYFHKPSPREIKLDLEYAEKILGTETSEEEATQILRSLGFNVRHSTLNILEVEIPDFRLDVSIPEDLIEEIGRIIGYDKIPIVFPVASLIPPKRNEDIFWENMVRSALKEAGFTEIYNYSFTSKESIEKFSLNEKDLLEIENPISSEYQYLRLSLLPNLLKDVKENFRFFDNLNIFELGKTYKKMSNVPENSSADGAGRAPARLATRSVAGRQMPNVIEKRILVGMIAGREQVQDGLAQIKGVIDLILERLGLSDVWYDTFEPTSEQGGDFWQAGACGEIKVGQEEIGFFGKVKAPADSKISGQVLAFEIDFEKLQKLAIEEKEYIPFSAYPSAVRDLAVLVPKEVRVSEVLNKINETADAILRDVDLFDLYEGEEIPGGKKNMAFHLIYQAEDRTLTSEEIDGAHSKIIEALEREPEWEVRK